MTDAALGATIQALRPRLLRDGIDGPAVEVAFAAVREITSRTLGKRHYPVQLLGGLVMIRGGLAEMQTGEGKTLTALLPAVTFALSGRP
ncbi:accessory Sec system translocase SecA2, partial [Staphylococcus aureus]